MDLVLAIREITLVALFAAMTSILAFVTIPLPFSPVPVTGQTLGIMLAGVLLGSRKAAISQLLYLLLGIIGLPVFTGGASGPGVLAGPTGGYLWGFVAGAWVTGRICEANKHRRPTYDILALITGGVAVVYGFGIAQLTLVTKMPPLMAITTGALPFLPGDGLKVVTALFIVRKAERWGIFEERGTVSRDRTQRNG